MSQKLRAIPAVEKILQALGETRWPRPTVLALVRGELAQLRTAKVIPPFEVIVARLVGALARLHRERLQPVINGTGVIIHTNLGRAPLAPAAVEALTTVAGNYNNLEFDLETGARGSRAGYLERQLALLCGAQAATVVNNCAAALVLMLRHFARRERTEVIISRGELVQIGGGFRIPEILEASGARLREVGTTNQTALRDYERAIGPHTALVLKVHRSNFFMDGFVESPPAEELAALARRKKIPLVEDLGSGAIFATEKFAGLEHEPTPAETLRRGVQLVCFSGDKLFGGPQAGIIAGQAKLITALKHEPFFRALRCDKLVFAALQATVDLHLRAAGASSDPGVVVPTMAMLMTSEAELRARAEAIVAALKDLPLAARVGRGKSQLGGGTLPRSGLESVTVEVAPTAVPLKEFAAHLRHREPPVIGSIAHQRFKLDLRTVFPAQDAEVVQALRHACTEMARAYSEPRS